jgi:hypothetical protein
MPKKQYFNLESSPLVMGGHNLAGGFSLNFELPDISHVTNQAYDFHKENSARNFAFLQNTSVQVGNYLNSQIQPVINSAMRQIDLNNGNMQNIYNQSSDLAYKHLQFSKDALTQTLSVQREISLRSIEAQRAAQSQTAKSGGMCFITTAVTQYMQLSDDCDELQTLRKFRDEYMLTNPDLQAYVAEYYSLAPSITEALVNHPEKTAIYYNMYLIIKSAVMAAKIGDNDHCLHLYCLLVRYAISAAAEYNALLIEAGQQLQAKEPASAGGLA